MKSVNIELVVVPVLTPDGYNLSWIMGAALNVVVPVLTPDGYNWRQEGTETGKVVVPVLTPDGYNECNEKPHHN